MDALFVDIDMGHWRPESRLYSLSEPFNGHGHIVVTVAATGTEVVPATDNGASIGDAKFGLIAHRSWFPPIKHEAALFELGYAIS